MAYKNTTDLTQNDTSAFRVKLPRERNCTVSIQSESGNHASATVRLDASWDHGETWKNSISLSDPTETIGAAFVTTVATGEVGQTQDRVFGATDVRVVRTDANGGACIVALSSTVN